MPAGLSSEELEPPLPRPLLHQLRLEPDLGQDQAHEPRVRAERVVVQDGHSKAAGSTGEGLNRRPE